MPDTAGVDDTELPTRLTTRLQTIVGASPGRLSVSVRGAGGFRFDHDADRVVPAASTIKVAILLAYLESGMPWDLPVSLAPADRRVGGCGPLQLLPSVTTLPAGELLALMIALSDNDATNAILDVLGVGAVGRLLARAGARHTALRRRMMDSAAVAGGQENETTAGEMAQLLARLRSGALVGPRESAMAMALLRAQQFDEGLGAFRSADVRCGDKTGNLPGIRHDVGVLERGGRWVAVAALCTDLADPGEGGRDRGTTAYPVFAAIGEALEALL